MGAPGPGEASVVVMGVSGSGKSVVGARLAAVTGRVFVDADDLHPPANIDKMMRGEPLDDADRAPWLDAVGDVLATGGVVVACSALRRAYRDRLLSRAPHAVFLELAADPAVIRARMGARDHFMPVALLDSQLAALEPLGADEPGVRLDATVDVEQIVAAAEAATGTLSGRRVYTRSSRRA
jgi:carbohydrate kinase (thermoresistant glucokinase family)